MSTPRIEMEWKHLNGRMEVVRLTISAAQGQWINQTDVRALPLASMFAEERRRRFIPIGPRDVEDLVLAAATLRELWP